MASKRFLVRQTPLGWEVYDRWTGQAVVVDGEAQSTLSPNDAQRLSHTLQRQAERGDRKIYV